MAEVNTPSEASAELARVVELLEKATPGEWAAPYYEDSPEDRGWWIHNGAQGGDEYAVAVTFALNPRAEADAILIPAAVNFLRKHGASLLSSHGGGGEAVAWTLIGPDGKSSIGGWLDMNTHDACKKYGTVREGHRYAYAYATPQPRAEGMVLDAARAFVAKLEAVHGNSEYESVWTIAQLHRGAYRGPTYTAELDALKAALAAAPGEGSGHQWDATGERCMKCGGKDWMGGPCTPPPASQSAKTEREIFGDPRVGVSFPADGKSQSATPSDGTMRDFRERQALDYIQRRRAAPSDELPELPTPAGPWHATSDDAGYYTYTPDQMRAYGQLCRNGETK